MKKFIIYIVLFFLPLVIFLGGLEIGLRNIPNDYAYKNNWLEHNIQNVQILSLGSSHGYLAIRPEYLDMPTFNAAHVSQSIKYDAFIFNKYIDRADSLRLLIWPMSYFSLLGNMEDEGEWWRAKGYCIYYDCPYHSWEIKYHSALFCTSYKTSIERVFGYVFSDYSDLNCDSLGWQVGNVKEHRTTGWYLNGKERADRHTKDLRLCQDNLRNNTRLVKEVITQCASRNIKVLLLTTPTCYTYYENVNHAQLEIMQNFCDSMAYTYDNVSYLNMFTDSRFTEDDFFDADHLEAEGAIKFTKILNDYISQKELK